MDAEAYQDQTARTAKREWPKLDDFDLELLNYALGCAGEGGEIADHVKKVVFHGHTLHGDVILKELGDYFWYGARLAALCGFTMGEVFEANIAKLRERYPEGFDPEKSRNRTS